ncbi:sensor histidine kinase [Kytococcus sp. Marseille-QA3725]
MFWTGDKDLGEGFRHRLETLRTVDLVIGHLSLPLLLLRHRRPVSTTVVLGLLMTVSTFVVMSFLCALVTLASHRRLPEIGLAVVTLPVSSLFYALSVDKWLQRDEAEGVFTFGFGANLAYGLVIALVFVLLGWNIGARRELAISVAEQAASAEREQAARLAQARVTERNRIAREMHDALGHRLSVLTMHANGLAYRHDLSAQEVREASGTIATQARTALNDLREILGVLRSDTTGDTVLENSPTPPDLSGVAVMVENAQQAGCPVTLDVPEALCEQAKGLLPISTSRHAFRIIQEALTNALKHAPGCPVLIEIGGRAGTGLTVRVVNELPQEGEEPTDVVSGGLGLTGLHERVDLAGGRATTGEVDGEFVVDVWLPWSRR